MPETVETKLAAQDVIRHLAHELRQPLSAMESIAFYLRMTANDGRADVNAQLERLQQMVDSANWVLSDMMHRLHAQPVSPAAVSLVELTDEVLTESWLADGFNVEQEYEEGLPMAWVDEEQLQHMLRSMVQFFRRTVEEPREIVIKASAGLGSIRIEVRALTPGVDAHSVFDSHDSNPLFTCRGIAENNGGRFTAETESTGQLCVRLEVPAAAVD